MKIICIGRNFISHAHELKNEVPDKPVIFLKPETALLRNNQDFFMPDFSQNMHYEVELVLKINKIGKNISPKFAHRYFNAIGLGIDFTARDLQDKFKAAGLPWELSKAFDYSAVISQFIPKDELGDLSNISFSLEKNGELVQQGNSGNMIFNFDDIISYSSQFFSLKTGDLFFTGTPSGVGPVAIGDRLQGFIGNQLMFDFFIR